MKLKLGIKTWILIIFILISLFSIGYKFDTKGAAIVYVERNSSAYLAGITYNPDALPTQLEVIKEINGHKIQSPEDFYMLTQNYSAGEHYLIITDKKTYDIEIKSIPVKVGNKTVNKTLPLGIVVDKVPRTNLKFGLDIVGGIRVLLKPVNKTSLENLSLAKDLIENRLNVYGLSDVKVRIVEDVSGNQYIVVELAGKTISNIKDLISKTGKFEAKLGNKTVFIGGNRDISYVARAPPNAGFDPQACPVPVEGGYMCRFRFEVHLTPNAAQRFYNVAKNLAVVNSGQENYLNESLYLYVDNHLVESLRVGAGLKEKPVTQVYVSGSGFGKTRRDAQKAAMEQMKKLQTILLTGSLPVKLQIVQVEEISPKLGNAFIKNAWILAIISILTVSLIVGLRYRDWRVTLFIILTMLSELIITLGIATWIRWNLDLAAIAGIIIAIGTGVDDQIVITDELKSKKKVKESWKERLARAFFIVFGSYFTTVAAMLPLLKAGAGLLKGFAFTTIIGVTIGVFISRPAFAEMLEKALKKEY